MRKIHELALAGTFCAAAVVTAVSVTPSTNTAAHPDATASVSPAATPAAVQTATVNGGCIENGQISALIDPNTPKKDIERLRLLIEQRVMTNEDGSRFQPVDRWGGMGQRGNPVSLTYSFPDDGILVRNIFNAQVPNTLHARLNAAYGNEAAWKAVFAAEFARWSAITGVTYTEVTDDNAAWSSSPGPFNGGSNRGDIRIVMGDNDGGSGVLAFNSFPDNGDMFLDEDENWAGGSTFFRNVLTHEHGHGIGLAHVCPIQGTVLMEPFINTGFLGPQLDDQISGQWLYGDRTEPNASGATSVNLPSMGLTNNGIPVSIDNLSIHSSSEVDLFRVESLGGTSITTSVTPVGSTYTQGPQNGSGNSGCVNASTAPFNALEIADLVISVLRPNFTVATSSDSNGAGSGESIVGFVMDQPGTWYVQISSTGSVTAAQLYNMTVSTSGGGVVADLSGDGCVDGTDLAVLLANWGNPGDSDLNNDNTTNGSDLAILLAAWTGSPC